jgi:thymidylate synthase ThyX
MAYACRILADSISPAGHRLTSFEVTFPRIVLAEVNTHRMLSRNSASSRAIPVERRIAAVETDPFVPAEFGKNKKGMQHDEVLSAEEAQRAEDEWAWACSKAIEQARRLAELGVHKQLANRLLEPFAWHTAVITATDWDNFSHLRVNPAAQGEFRRAAEMMLEAYKTSEPHPVNYGDWHTPYVEPGEAFNLEVGAYAAFAAARISAARCARVSYLTQDGKRDANEDLALYERLVGPGHLSPLEHPARPMTQRELELTQAWDVAFDDGPMLRTQCPPGVEPKVGMEDRGSIITRVRGPLYYSGNLNGWVQLRKLIPGEHDILGQRTEEAT